MTIVTDLKNVRLPNIVIFGVIPTLILYATSNNFSDFIDKVECLRTADPLVIYFAVLFFVVAILAWSGYWVRIITPKRRSFVKTMGATLRSIYYVVSGICFTAGAILAFKVSTLTEIGIVLITLMVGVFFLIGAILVVLLLPPTLRPES